MVKVSIDYTKLEKSLKDFSKKLDKEVSDSVVEMAQLASKQLAHHTQPFGTSEKQKNILQSAIYKDVNKAYSTIGRTYVDIKALDRSQAAAYINAIKANDLQAAENIIERVLVDYTEVKNSDAGEHLQSLRNSRGRVDRRSPMNLIDNGAIEDIKRKVVVRAGLVKAGFLKAGEAIKSKFRIPAWLRSSENIGSATVELRGSKTSVTLINHVRYASSMISPSNIQNALRKAHINQLKKLKRQIEALAKKV